MSLIEYDKAMFAYRNRPPKIEAQVIPVQGLYQGLTAYNGAPWVKNETLCLLSRLEPIDSEISWVEELNFADGFLMRNGLVIPDAQDPSVSFFAPDRAAIGVVAITEDLVMRGRIAAYRPKLYEFNGEVVNQENVAMGPEFQKDVRVAYMGSWVGEDLTAIVARERQDNGHGIQSYLQVGIVPTAGDMQHLSYDITQVKNDPASRLDVLTPDNRTWIGPNQLTPLQSRENKLVIGCLFHTGRLTNRLYENGERGRFYAALVTEISVDPETRQVTSFTKPKIIATADVFPYTEAKRPALRGVHFAGGFVFGMKMGLVKQTILFGGLRDIGIGSAEMPYPFSLPPDPRLNGLSILPLEKMPTIRESYSFY